jgi:regulator of sigma D
MFSATMSGSSTFYLVAVLLFFAVALGVAALIFFIKRSGSGQSEKDNGIVSAPIKSPQQDGRDNEIQFDAGLITKLKDDHQILIDIFTEINQSADNGHFNKLPELLSKFTHSLQSHIVTENVKFYVYMRNKLKHDKENSTNLADVRREMDGIARAVIKFTSLHSVTPITYETVAIFKRELGEIGEVLVKRVQLEEGMLYPMYVN